MVDKVEFQMSERSFTFMDKIPVHQFRMDKVQQIK